VPNVLEGVRVLSLAINLPGPLAASRLAALGATVIKVEPPSGDPLAAAAPGWYAELTSGQEIVTLDLKLDADRAELDDLLQAADILLTSNRPSALRRLGLLDANPALHPQLSHVEIVGHDGEREDLPGHDLNFQASHGTLDPPHMPLVPVVDLLGAERAVQAALAAVLSTQRTGRGVHERVVLEQAAMDAGAPARNGLTGPGTPLGGALPTYAVYPSADGHVAVGAIEGAFHARLLSLLGVGNTHAEIAAALASKTGLQWEQWAAAHDIPLTAVRTHGRVTATPANR